MRNTNSLIINGASDASGNTTSAAVWANQWVSVSFMAYFSENTAAGTVKIQYSNDPQNGVPNNEFTPTNWADVPGTSSTATASSGGSVTVYPPVNFCAQWYRIVFTRTGGAGTFSVAFNAIGV